MAHRVRPLRRRRMLQAGLALGAGAGLGACAAPGGGPEPLLAADGAGPGEAPLNEAGRSPRVLQRISLGSCADQTQPQPIWQAVLADAPDLHLFGGDNVYASQKPWTPGQLQAAYAQLAQVPGVAAVRRRVPHLAVWDDHDYGLNDGDAGWAGRVDAKAAFAGFWRLPSTDERLQRGGIHHARRFGPPGRCVQVLVLDVRWFRSPWQPTDQRDAPGKQRYLPSTDRSRTLLGEAQWDWLAERLAEPADLRLLLSGIQVVAEGHGFEHWGLFPHEQQRLLDLMARQRASGVLLLSGDRHIGGVYRRSRGAAYPLTELTSSGLTHAWAQADEPGPNRLGPLVRENHYARIDIDWTHRRLQLSHRGVQGQLLQAHELNLDALAAA